MNMSPLKIKIMLESKPLKSRIVVRTLAVNHSQDLSPYDLDNCLVMNLH